jgi:hypothetical protein
MLKPLSLALPLLLLGCAGARDREAASADRVPAATPAGEPRSCIPITAIRESRVRSDRVIDFVMRGREVYRVTLPQGCPRLGFEERLAYATSLSQLCSNDIITVLTSAGPGLQRGASCGLAPFQPVTLARR